MTSGMHNESRVRVRVESSGPRGVNENRIESKLQ